MNNNRTSVIQLYGRLFAQNVFGGLKAHWQKLIKRNEIFIHNVPTVAAAAYTYIWEIHHDQCNDAWLAS